MGERRSFVSRQNISKAASANGENVNDFASKRWWRGYPSSLERTPKAITTENVEVTRLLL